MKFIAGAKIILSFETSVYYKCAFLDATIEYQAFTSKLPLKNCRNLLVEIKVGVTAGMQDVARRMVLLAGEPMDELDTRLNRRKSPDAVVIDSFQYTGMDFNKYLWLKRRHPNKLIVIISQADGTRPKGRTAVSVMYDAALKIWVEGYRAFSKGRYFGPKGYYTIWEERASEYWKDGNM